jgi:hypothetical protein
MKLTVSDMTQYSSIDTVVSEEPAVSVDEGCMLYLPP